MSPPAPIPEHKFNQFLQEIGCKSVPAGKHYAVVRISDNKRITTYPVLHGKGRPREVIYVYKTAILKALENIRLEEELASREEAEQEAKKKEDWKSSDWYKEQQKYEH